MTEEELLRPLVIDNPEVAERFIAALEQSEEYARLHPFVPPKDVRIVKDPDEIRELYAKWQARQAEKEMSDHAQHF